MQTSERGRLLIEKSFQSIGGVKSFSSFGRLTAEQQECVQYLRDHAREIYANKHRDVHLHELVLSIAASEEEEEDELISEGTFSQYQFYQTYIHDLIYYPEKFDFLLKCIENQVCLVRHPARFLSLLEQLCMKEKMQTLPEGVVHYDRLLEEDEEKRIESFTLRKDWKCTVPHYLDIVADGDLPIATQ